MDFGSYFDGKCEMGAKESKIENKSESLNETEMADYLNVDLFKVKEWVDNKKLPSEVLNGRDSFNKDKVDEWISKSKITE